jgi:molybdate transport system permease protein
MRSDGILLGGAAFASLALLLLPLIGLAFESPWGTLGEVLAKPEMRQALGLSLFVATSAVVLSLILGFPVAWLLARTQVPGRGLLRTLVTLPMVMPPVVAGVGLLAAFGRHGLLGQALDLFGIHLPFTTLAAVIAATFVSAPFLVSTLEAGLVQSERRYEDVAATLGASRWRIFTSVVLPAIRPSLLAGIALCGARALGEFGATLTFAGNLPGRTQTVPLAIYQTLQTRPSEAFLMALVLLVVSLAVLALVRVPGTAR